jgi:hypothetical protein
MHQGVHVGVVRLRGLLVGRLGSVDGLVGLALRLLLLLLLLWLLLLRRLGVLLGRRQLMGLLGVRRVLGI